MTDMIQGLNIGLTLDTTGITAGLKDLKRDLKSVDSEMKANMSAFSRSERSVEKYETKLTGINRKLGVQEQAVNAARREHERMVEIHGEGSRQAQISGQNLNNLTADFNNLQRYTQETREEFERFQREQEIATSNFGRLSSAMEDVGGQITAIGDGMADAGKKISLGITAPIAGIAFAANRAFYEVDEGLDNVTLATGATGDELANLQESFKNVYGSFPTDAATLGDTLGEVNTRFGYTDDKLEETTEKFLRFADITGMDAKTGVQLVARAMGDAGIEADEYASVLDSIARAAQLTGIGADTLTESLTKFGAPMRALGFDMDESVALFANWEKAGVNTDVAMSGLRKSISAWGKEGKDPREEFEKTLKSIEAAPDIAEATALSIEAFGSKAGPDLADAIQGGRFEYAGLLEDLRSSKGTVDGIFDNTVDGAEKFQVAMQNLKLVGTDIWGTIETAIGPVLENIVSKLQEGVKAFSGLSDQTKTAGIIFAAIAAAIGPVLVVLGTMISMFGGVMTALAPLALKIAEAGGLMKYLRGIMVALTGPVGLTVAAIVLLGSAFVAAYKNSETFRDSVSKVVEFVKGIGSTIKETVGGLKGLFKEGGQKASDFLGSIGLSDSALSKKDGVAQNISAFRGNVQNTISGIRGLLSGQRDGGLSILRAIGFTDDFVQKADDATAKIVVIRDFIGSAISKVKDSLVKNGSDILAKVQEVFILVWPAVKAAFSGVVTFIGEQIAKIVQFWDENGAVILKAVSNIAIGIGAIFKGIVTVVSTVLPPIITIVSGIFKGILSVVEFIMPAVLGLIRAVWGNIRGVISGSLDIIMGAVKIFSGLFAGDFSKMFEGLKQIFSGAIEFLWNFISLTFFGRLLGGLKLFVGGFKLLFSGMWTTLKTLFASSTGALKTTISGAWSSIASTTSRIFGNIWTFIKEIFTKVRDSISNAVLTIYTKVVTQWTNIFNRTSSIFGTIRDLISRIFASIRDTVARIASNIYSRVTGSWTTLKNKTSEIFGNIFTTVKGKFDDIVNAAKALPQRMGDGIKSMASKVKDGVRSVTNNLANTLGKGVNGVIGGINWVLGKIGVSKDIPKWDIPQYAMGTKGHHPGGPMVVGDGKNSNSGPELIETPDGKQVLSPSKPTLTTAPKGTKVWSATETKKILDMVPHYALGDDIKSGLRTAGNWAKDTYNSGKNKVKAVGSKIKDVAVNAFDYIKSPGKFLDLALKTLGIEKPKSGNFIGDMAVGGWNKTKTAAINFVKEKLASFGSSQSGISLTGGNGGGFGKPFRFTSGPGPRNTGIPGASTFHKGWDWAAPIGTKIPSVTDGIGHRVGFHPLSGNFVEVKSGNKVHRYQHNSKNMLRVGQQVKKGQTVGLVGNTGVGSGAHLHYEVKGLETGGLVNREQLVNIGEKNREEMVIPMHPSRRTDAMKLLALAGKKLSGGGDKGITRPNSLPNVGGGGNAMDAILAATEKTNEFLMKQNELLMQLLRKDIGLYVDGNELANAIGDPMDSQLGKSSTNNMWMNGVRG